MDSIPIECITNIIQTFDARDLFRLCSTCKGLWEIRYDLLKYIHVKSKHIHGMPQKITIFLIENNLLFKDCLKRLVSSDDRCVALLAGKTLMKRDSTTFSKIFVIGRFVKVFDLEVLSGLLDENVLRQVDKDYLLAKCHNVEEAQFVLKNTDAAYSRLFGKHVQLLDTVATCTDSEFFPYLKFVKKQCFQYDGLFLNYVTWAKHLRSGIDRTIAFIDAFSMIFNLHNVRNIISAIYYVPEICAEDIVRIIKQYPRIKEMLKGLYTLRYDVIMILVKRSKDIDYIISLHTYLNIYTGPQESQQYFIEYIQMLISSAILTCENIAKIMILLNIDRPLDFMRGSFDLPRNVHEKDLSLLVQFLYQNYQNVVPARSRDSSITSDYSCIKHIVDRYSIEDVVYHFE
jgi:hypothetical protein